ncbi:EAL domain-containing protein [Sansalvadorimonas verongulae]|uniref:EAL domain-containing protein n=1 Tax=Sansalvadorimonas verongulae TaxID=2172824 RepID=UPI0012BCA0D6|nr:GGDEF domain-containing phosphodiesterase [Sansalvadorimonas verongulae]MTI13206.1 EAL domain-containing protein [Sansalvadorimonas verongulae]
MADPLSSEHATLENRGPLRLLFLEDARNQAESLVSHFRNSGLATRVHRITSSEDLQESLNTDAWDLLLAFEGTATLTPDEALVEVTSRKKDLPSILLQGDEVNYERITEWLQAGGADAIPFNQSERLKLVCMREWSNLLHRRQKRINEVALREAEKRCQLLLDSSVDAIAYVHEGMHIHANPAYVELFGHEDPDDLTGMPLIDMVHRENQNNLKQLIRQFQQGETDIPPLEFKGEKNDGEHFDGVMTLSAAKWDGEQCTQVVIRKTEAKADPELEKKLAAMKSTDMLTGLFNRAYFTEQLDATMAQSLSGDRSFAVIDIRLDQFRDIKKELGVARADAYLAKVAQQLKPIVGELGILARYSDDVLLALIHNDLQPRLKSLGEKILSEVKGLAVNIEEAEIQTTASLGIMAMNEKANSSHYILTRAERACRKARENGGDQLAFHDYQAELQAMVKEGDIVALVTQALEQDRFKLSFQPVLNLEHENEQQYEVFSRLENDEGEIIPVSEFIAASKRAGLTTRIDRWAILHAIKALAEHRSLGRKTRVFLSLGPDSIQDQTLPSWINVTLKAAKLPGNAFIFQMQEEDLLIHSDAALLMCQNLQKLGCGVCITHFGTTPDSFELLGKVSTNMVKVSGSLVADLDEEEAVEKLQTIVTTLREQNKQVLIPRVESNKTLSLLWQWDVTYVQGYYLQAPMDSMDYEFQ